MSIDVQSEELHEKVRVKVESIENMLSALINTQDYERLGKIEKYLSWIEKKTKYVKEEAIFKTDDKHNLIRGHIILAEVGFNVGEEFGGRHYCLVLNNSNKSNKRVVVIPITSQEPKNKHLPFYVKLGKVRGLNPTKVHWVNIFNVKTISKQRIISSTSLKTIDGRALSRVSQAIVNQIAKRKDTR